MSSAFDPSGLTALVVDANAYARGISLDQLRAMGFGRTLGAAAPADAWDLLREAAPDIVLLEWVDDGRDGLEFVRRIRQSEDSPNRAVSIFMLTSRGDAGAVETARAAGVDGYLRKPISALALQQRVRKVVSKPQPFVMTATYVGPCRRRPRPQLVYAGPWRRLDDASAVTAEEAEHVDLKAELARACVAALETAARNLTPGDANAARAVYSAVQALVGIGEDIGDASLCAGARDMARYVQAQGATDRLDPEVVRLHIAALNQLALLPQTLVQERQRVADSLKRMVDKKLRQPATAA
ncbi:MAG: response regulator [Hyphomonadaceae bacterium]|nr:response regulator [Hyphomonadaceae bacterium]